MTQIRLNKYLAGAGITSRRKADELIQQGKVRVNSKIITDLGVQIDPDKDKVEYQGKILQPATPLLFMFNKPRGVTSTMADVHAEKTIADYFKDVGRVYPVGRLDKDSEGLMIVTNDGDLANKLMHPRYEHEKEYEVIISPRHAEFISASLREILKRVQDDEGGRKHDDLISKFSQRFALDGYKTQPMKAKLIKKINPPHQSSPLAELPSSHDELRRTRRLASPNPSPYKGEERRGCWLISLILQEGRKRQIRRVAEILGYKVIQLKRVRIGKLKLGNLLVGKYRRVSVDEII